MKSIKIAIAAGLLLASGSALAAKPSPDEELAEMLAGLKPGEPVRCIKLQRIKATKWLGTGTILFKVRRSLVYRNDPPGGCGDRMRIGLQIVTNADSLQLCEGDNVGLVDLRNDIRAGACRLGRFVPFTKAD